MLILPGIPVNLQAKPFFGVSVGRFNGTQEVPSSFLGGMETGFEGRNLAFSIDTSLIQQETREGLRPSGAVTLIPILSPNQGGGAFKGQFRSFWRGGWFCPI